MVKKTLKTQIKWIDKKRVVGGFDFKMQNMYGREVAVFDRNDLRKLIKDIKSKKAKK